MRRAGPVNMPVVTIAIIVANFIVFFMELAGGDAFVLKWSAIPAHISQGQDLITLFTAMFLHGGWSHIIRNMIFFWAFGPKSKRPWDRSSISCSICSAD